MSVEDLVEDDLTSNDDFDAGFDSSLEATVTPDIAVEEPVVEVVVAAETPKFAQITEEDYQAMKASLAEFTTNKATSQSQFDKAFGQLGGMKQRIEQLQTATPAGEPIVATMDDFAEMSAEYPDFAKKQMNALNKVLSKLKGTGSQAAPVIDNAARDASFRQEIIDNSLEVVFPDWKNEVKSLEFDKWFQKQTAEIKGLASSNSVGHAAKMLKLYDAAKNTPPAKTEVTARQKQLEAAVNPKGVGRGTPTKATEDDDFNAGFNAER